ncbi:MAG TPA: gamma-glutamyltransferase [Candidatus Baltobacteraceae bacterium]|nr:gamma-glutamyltransferase [Candidatus Baltobacteraceae bacterium]
MTQRIFAGALAAVLFGAAGSAQPPSWQSTPPARSSHAMIVTEQHYATQAGLEILKRGGNAVDAAVAVAYALAVVDPCCGNIGGGGFMLVRMHTGAERFIDFREKAPLRANPHMYLDANGEVIPHASTKGYLAVGVPGTVMGMERAREDFGTLPRSELMAPAVRLAQVGFNIQAGDAAIFGDAAAQGYGSAYAFGNQPNVRDIFMRKGRLPKAGDVLRQPQLAATLRLVAKDGAPAFYEGTIAHEIVDASYKNGGMLAMDDFKNYTVEERAPIHCAYRGYVIVSAPPPSSGGTTLCEILNVLSAYPLHAWGWHSTQSAHYVIEAERRAYADRNTYLGDPAFVKNPVSDLLSQAYAEKLRASIQPGKATPSVNVHPGLGSRANENDDTTHFSIVDKWGNAVAVTYTINNWFGAGVIAGDTGFFLNDEMDDFTSKPGVPNMFGLVQGVRNDIQPGKRPLSSMTPTIVTKNGRLFMVTGSPGGSRIITIVLATIQNVVDYGMNAAQAVNAPRLHMQWLPDEIQMEPGALDASTMNQLAAMGYAFKQVPSWGSAQAIVVDPITHMLDGGTDRRHPAGLAAGY